METDTVTEKIERYRLLAEQFLNEDIRVAIWDINGEYYFADLILVGENLLKFQAFSPRSKSGKEFTLRWVEISKLIKYEEKEDGLKD